MGKIFSIKVEKIKKHVYESCIKLNAEILGIKIKHTFEGFSFTPNFIKKAKFKNLKYNIIPIGTFCLPRVITTEFLIKPSKKYGEKSCPFDLGFFLDINAINTLIETKFKGFFNNATFDNENNYWLNASIDATFNHDHMQNKEEFIARYNARIQNFYNYLTDDKVAICVHSTLNNSDKNTDFNKMFNILKKIRGEKPLKLFIINTDNEFLTSSNPDIIFVNGLNFQEINKNALWVDEIRQQTPAAKIFCKKIIDALNQLISEI